MLRGRLALPITALALLAVVAGCAQAGPAARGPDAAHGTVLQRGQLQGKPWVLTAFRSGDDRLCMGVNESEGDDPNTDAVVGSGCGFGPPDAKGGSDLLSTVPVGPHASTLYLAPAPPGVVRAQLVSYRTPPTASDGSSLADPGCSPSSPAKVAVPVRHRLPGRSERGGWFVVALDDGNGCGYELDAFYDASGRRVSNHDW